MSIASFFLKTAAMMISPVRYVERGVENVKENIKEDIEGIIANVVKITVLILVGFAFLIFVSIMIANILNEALRSAYLGYAVVSGFYLLTLLILYVVLKTESNDGVFRSHAKRILRKR